jgi:hypothetical protein
VSFSCRTSFILDSARASNAESSFEKPGKSPAPLTFSSIRRDVQMRAFDSPLLFASAVLAALTFSPVQRRIHMRDSHSPVFSAPAVLEHISKPQERLINSSRLLVYSVNRFHFGVPPNL